MVKEGRLKRHRDKVKQYKQNRTFLNNKRKFYLVGGEYTKTNQEPDAKEAKQLWSKIWEQKEYKRKAKRINNMKKELQVIEEGLAVDKHLELLFNWVGA